jgi:MSHA biogenesis protein MshM
MSWRERFGMHATPLPRGAVGESFFEGDPHYQRLAQAFAWLASEPGIGVLTGEPGVGKTSSLVDERGVVPIVILDDAQGLRDDLLHELHGLCSLDFDGRDYLTLWLVGHPLLARRLRLQQHAALAQRVIVYAPLVAKTDPALVGAMLEHALAAAGAPPDLIVDDARAMLLRAARGLPRLISHLLRLALVLADEREQPRIDASIMNSAIILLHLEPHSPPPLPPAKPRATQDHGKRRFERDPRSRK